MMIGFCFFFSIMLFKQNWWNHTFIITVFSTIFKPRNLVRTVGEYYSLKSISFSIFILTLNNITIASKLPCKTMKLHAHIGLFKLIIIIPPLQSNVKFYGFTVFINDFGENSIFHEFFKIQSP